MQISNVISQMGEFRSELLQTSVAGLIEPARYLKRLTEVVELLESKIDGRVEHRRTLDPEETWAKWRILRYDFSKLSATEIRTLCTSPLTAFRPKLLDALERDPSCLKRFTVLCGFVGAYFQLWRSMEHADQAEKLTHQLLRPGVLVRKSKVLEAWRRESRILFSANAHVHLASVAVRQRKRPREVCAEMFVDLSTPLAASVKRETARQWVMHLLKEQAKLNEREAVEELKWITANLLDSDLDPETYRSVIGNLILSELPDRYAAFQTAIVDEVHSDDRLGDPRLLSCEANWRSMPPLAKERFLAWLAKETLQFFFNTLVPQNDENRRRAEFWLQFAKKQGKIKDFQVAVSDDDRPKIRAARSRIVPRYALLAGGRTSAFLMQFEGFGTEYVIIEFSETGNAAYIYERKSFEAVGISLRSLSYHLTNDLKRMGAVHERLIHRSSTHERWETKARAVLMELGIRP
jgi:hypothetical protein